MEYRSTGIHRSTIPGFHNSIMENQSVVFAFMSVIFNKKPAKLKYPYIWFVKNILDFFRKLPGDDLLSVKLITLMVSS